jgi:hypothetical protein
MTLDIYDPKLFTTLESIDIQHTVAGTINPTKKCIISYQKYGNKIRLTVSDNMRGPYISTYKLKESFIWGQGPTQKKDWYWRLFVKENCNELYTSNSTG